MSSCPWIANVDRAAAECCHRVGAAPRGRVNGESAWSLNTPNGLPTVLISITEPGCEAFVTEGWHAILRLAFQDYDPQRIHWEQLEDTRRFAFMTPEQASELAAFAIDHRGSNFVVHCSAGVSRSGAVVEALLQAFPEYEDRGWPRYPNCHVLTLLKRALGLVPIGYEEPRPYASHDSRIQFTEGE